MKMRRILMGAAGSLLVSALHAAADERMAPNRPELSLPLLNRKLVLAHFMTAFVDMPEGVSWGREKPVLGLSATPDATAKSKSVAPMYLYLYDRDERDREEVARSEVRAAEALGVDGFQFFYPYHKSDAFLQKYNKIIKVFFDVCGREFPNFKMNLCLCTPEGETEAAKIDQWAAHIGALIAETKESTAWLKTPDGRHIMYQWVGDQLSDEVKTLNAVNLRPEAMRAVAEAYERLARAAGIRVAYIYHMRYPENEAVVNAAFDYFPAIWLWVDGEKMESYRRLDAIARARGRVSSVTVYPEFYGHDYFKGKGVGRANRPKRGEDPPAEALWRSHQVCRLTETYRKLLQMVVDLDSPLMSVATWNDYTEATHLAPEMNFNFVPGVLLNHYKALWLDKRARSEKEVGILAFKKYASALAPAHAIELRANTGPYRDATEDDHIEALTILREPGELFVNGRHRKTMAAGLDSCLMPLEVGPVKLEVRRGGRVVISVVSREWITDRPYRTDRISYMLSSDFGDWFEKTYPGRTQRFLSEYGEATPGVPNWKSGRSIAER